MTERTYDELARLTAEALQLGRSVVVDASFSTPWQRQRFTDLSSVTGIPLHMVLCELPEDITRQRLDARVETGGVPTDGRWKSTPPSADSFQLPDELPADSVLRLNVSGSPQSVLDAPRLPPGHGRDRIVAIAGESRIDRVPKRC